MLKIMLIPYSTFRLPKKYWLLLCMLLSLFISSCNAKYKRIERIEGTYFPKGTVKLEGRKAESLDNKYILTISQPLYFNELGNVFIHDFWNSEKKGGYEKIKDQIAGVLYYEAAKTNIPSLGEYYIPVVMLKQTGNFEYHKRTLNFAEWIQENTILTIFICTILLILIIVFSKRKMNYEQKLRTQMQKEAELLKLRKIREGVSSEESELSRRKDIVLDIVNNLYKETAMEVQKTSIDSLFFELQKILNMINSDVLNDALINSNNTAFQSQIDSIKLELHNLKKLALNAQLKRHLD